LQGGLGDCWLLCALAALAEFPNYFKDHIFMTDKVSPDGKYDLQLYDAKVRDWITVTIDDRIPCAEKKWYDTARPLFAQPHENEMYALLIEKAFAKMSGTYGKLAGGYPALAWMALTGCEDLHFWGKNSDGKSWTKRLAATDKIRENPWNFQGMWVMGTSHKNENDEMFEFLKECDKLNYVMGASIHGDIMEKARKDGLIERHAYSMIQVYEKEDIKLVQLRNPWGNNHEWNGDWSDKSRKWREHPEIAKDLEWNNDPDGLFWIHWDDFVRVFHDIQIAAKTMVKKRGDFKKLIEEE
jgi:calpain-15